MLVAQKIARWGGVRLSRRAARSIPWIGTAVALATVAATIGRKGFFGGMLDTGLNAVPFVGAAKNVAEVVRGRDFIPDRPRAVAVRPIPPAPRPASPAR
jgi:hypothetical protein